VESRVGVAETLLASAQSSEVLNGSGSYTVVEVEVDATGLLLNLVWIWSTIGVQDWALPGHIEVGLDSHFVGRLAEATYALCKWFGGGVFDGKRILEKRSCCCWLSEGLTENENRRRAKRSHVENPSSS